MHFAKNLLLCISLLLLTTSCDEGWLSEEDELYLLDLGLAFPDGNKSVKFMMDDSTWIYPDRKLKEPIETGKRYKLHYNALSPYKRDSANAFKANILDIINVPVLPVELFLNPLFTSQEYQSIDVDRFWLGGGFLNVSFNCQTGNENEVHYTQMIRSDFYENDIHLRLYHFKYEADSVKSLPKHGHTLSFPLASIPDFYTDRKSICIEVFHEGEWQSHTIEYSDN